MTVPNLYACLVHEQIECVVDLVRNLKALDPDSSVLVYNGGRNPALLRYPFERLGAILHPAPHPQRWGQLHGFALDCMHFALAELPFRTFTIVDSDQLALRHGYGQFVLGHAERLPRVGLFSEAPDIQGPASRLQVPQAAWKEVDLWRPLLRHFKNGEEKFAYWSFWPGTVFTAEAARALLGFLERDDRLVQNIVAQTRIWATEEILLPTLVALLGFEIGRTPCRRDYVRYLARYNHLDFARALALPNVYWMHPVTRRYDDPLRAQIRVQFNHYRPSPSATTITPGGDIMSPQTMNTDAAELLLPTLPILSQVRKIDGWLWDEEADLLLAAAQRAMTAATASPTIVEVGSYCGRSTVVLGSAAKALGTGAKVYAIDPHESVVDQGPRRGQQTIEVLRRNLAEAGLDGFVVIVRKHSFEVEWLHKIDLLFLDGWHDYANVSRDFHHFERWIREGGLVAFHDYAPYWPDVMTFVDQLLQCGQWAELARAQSLIVLQRIKRVSTSAGREQEGMAKA